MHFKNCAAFYVHLIVSVSLLFCISETDGSSRINSAFAATECVTSHGKLSAMISCEEEEFSEVG